MEKEITITLTPEEIECLEISIVSEQGILRDKIDNLSEHNKTGINTKSINQKRAFIEKLEKLYDKLYEAEKSI